MPYFVRDDVGLREVAASFVFIRKLVEKAEIEINFTVPRAIKRPRLRARKAAAACDLIAEKPKSWLLVTRAGTFKYLAPNVLGLG